MDTLIPPPTPSSSKKRTDVEKMCNTERHSAPIGSKGGAWVGGARQPPEDGSRPAPGLVTTSATVDFTCNAARAAAARDGGGREGGGVRHAAGSRAHQMPANGKAARGLAEDGDALGVAAKRRDVVLGPPQSRL
jgi:hypothetical protein